MAPNHCIRSLQSSLPENLPFYILGDLYVEDPDQDLVFFFFDSERCGLCHLIHGFELNAYCDVVSISEFTSYEFKDVLLCAVVRVHTRSSYDLEYVVL